MLRHAVLAAPLVLAGCGAIPFLQQDLPAGANDPSAPIPAGAQTSGRSPAADSVVAPPSSVTARPEALDTTTEAERQAARAEAEQSAADSRALGTVTATLGDPAEQGLWLKSDLVSEEREGLVTTAGGASATLTLRPLGGDGGAQLSLAAMRTLDLSLAGVHEVTVSAQ
jgi:hypothetical protein